MLYNEIQITKQPLISIIKIFKVLWKVLIHQITYLLMTLIIKLVTNLIKIKICLYKKQVNIYIYI